MRRSRRAHRVGRDGEDRYVHLAVLLEPHPDGRTDVQVRGRAVDDVGRQPQVRLLVELDHGDHVRRGHVGVVAVVVHREAEHGPPPADRLGLGGAAAHLARSGGRVLPAAAGPAPLDEQGTVGAAGPVRPVAVVQRREEAWGQHGAKEYTVLPMSTDDRAPALAPPVVSWIESVTGLPVTGARQIPAGGRLGWFVDVGRGGTSHELFLQSGRGLGDGPSSFQGFEIEAEVYRALRPHGIPVPTVWGVDKDLDLLLVDRIPGTVWFHPPADPDEQLQVAQDFVRHLATWHRLGAAALDLPSFGPVKTWREHQLDQLARSEAMMSAAGGAERLDPLVTRSMDWLRANVPDLDGPVVLVQGDTGPGNFLYRDGRVTGIIDWELAHLGDPMDDIAWLSWRTAQHSFTHFPDRVRHVLSLVRDTRSASASAASHSASS